MTLTLGQQMEAIRTSKMTQFFPPIQIPASSLVLGQETLVRLPGLASNLWLPPTFIAAGAIQANPAALVVGVRINRADALMLPWGLAGNNVSTFTGPVEQIYVTLLSGVAAQLTLHAARGIGIGYSGGNTAAGTPSSAPGFATGGTDQF